jgi:plasmid stabilization system protein ParE
MPQVRISARAQADIARLFQFLRVKDLGAAQRAVQAIRGAMEPLKRFPQIGRPVEDRPELRELVIDFGATGYVALYRFEEAVQTVTILALKHQREDDYH